MSTRIKVRRGTAAAWTSANPTLAAGEPGFETDTGKLKIGDGSTAWNSLAYGPAGVSGAPSGAAGGALDGTYPNPGIAASVAGSGLSESSNVLAVNVDGSTIEISSDALRVKDDGITAAKIAANAVTESEISLSDVTSDNVSTSAHGFAPKAPNDATQFLDGTAAWDTVKDSDLSLSDITTNNVSITKHGFVPKAPNLTSQFLRGDASWATFPGDFPAGATTKIFDSTLGSDTASIDSGAGSIPGTFDVLEIWMLLRTSDAGATANADVILNNDTSALYDRMAVSGVNATASAGNTLAATQWQFGVHGSGGGASYASYLHFTIPAYAQTNFFKSGTLLQGRPDSTAGNNAIAAYIVTYKSTAAITRVKVAATGAASLKTGSRLVVYGR